MTRYFLTFYLALMLISCNTDTETQAINKETSQETSIELPNEFIKDIEKELISEMNSENINDTYFQLVPNEKTGIDFVNKIVEDAYRNHKSYPQIYGGGGVAVGDLNNDGLPDIYFAGNAVKDKIYFNTGNFTFEDVTELSGIGIQSYGWTFGVNMVDINADGFLDIYVCKAGPYSEEKFLWNRLFVNNGDGTFKEDAASYGLNIPTYSVQSTFFDYDRDGDLDMYLINHPIPGSDEKRPESFESYVSLIERGVLRTDNFYENINGKYVDKTDAAKLVNYGFKNSVGVGDINKDGFPDLYVCTDYGEPDLFYINNGNKTFSNKIEENLKHITYNSMGNDISDINNDGNVDIYITDMAPNDHVKSKIFMATMNPDKFNSFVDNGFHHQYMLNTLQLNNGNSSFSEIGQLLGLAKTDWSWAPLFFDIDMDGNKDLFITNGIKENLNDNDIKEKVYAREKELNHVLSIDEYLEVVPSVITPNQIFKNDGNLHFTETSNDWMDNKSFNSNGAAYADFDGDGDFDLVLNNMEDKAAVYENKGVEGKVGNSLSIILKGPNNNPFAIGTKITIPLEDQTIYHEHYPARGYLSSVDYKIILGLGAIQKIPKMIIEWPDGKTTSLINIDVNKEIIISYNDLQKFNSTIKIESTFLKKLTPQELGIDFKHTEDEINDFRKQVLLPYSQSQNGPFIATADVNNDGLTDFYVGGAAGSAGELYIQTSDSSFIKDSSNIWSLDKSAEDLGVMFFDYDGDGDEDLYVTSGGAAFAKNASLYQDRIYSNDGNGVFSKVFILPENTTSTQVVISSDVDGDGDLDIFVGGRIIPDEYPFSPTSQLLINENGVFEDKTNSMAPSLLKAGLVTDATFSDYDGDGDKDLIVSAEWSPIKIYENNGGNFSETNLKSLEGTEGIWFSVKAFDIDNDGDDDYLFGNLGLNSKFTAKPGKPFHVFCDDFDDNGTFDIVFSKDYKGNLVPMRGRQCSSEQMPFISDKFKNYKSFAAASLNDIIGEENLSNALHYETKDFHSICLINEGKGEFKKINLPIEAQFSPIMNFTVANINSDASKEIIAVGNMYPTEVETTRYDASRGVVLQFNNGKFDVLPAAYTGLRIDGDSKDAVFLDLNGVGELYLVSNNNSSLETYLINKKQ